jgi:hypothetical protein
MRRWRSDERLIYAAPGGVLLQDVTRDGKAVVTRYDRSMQVEGAFEDSDARGISWLDFQFARDLTPDGRRILFAYSGQGSSPNYDVYVHTVGESEGTRIGEGQPQQFSPDGSSVLAVDNGPSQIHLTRDGRSYVANYGRSQDTLFLVEGLK